MPLSVNVGLSRKASRDFQSTGVSINLTAELDQSLLARPDELQERIQALYQQAESALSRRAGEQARQGPGSRQQLSGPSARSSSGGSSNGHHQLGSSGRQGNGRSNGARMTESQRRAIDAIARRISVDAVLESRDIIGVELAELSVSQASELIDHLKGLQQQRPAGARNGGAR